jgi:RHS repeat-associated protein
LATVVGPDGGEITTPDRRFRVTVPAEAVDEPTQVLVSSSAPIPQSGSAVEFDITLFALTTGATLKSFSAPVSVEITPRADDLQDAGVPADQLAVRKEDPETGTWSDISEADVDPSPGVYEVNLEFPGRYGLVGAVVESLDTSAKVITASGGTLESSAGDFRLDFPEGATNEDLRVEYRKVNQYGSGDFRLVRQFELSAFAISRGDAEVSAFEKAVTVSVRHSREELAGLSYEGLTLYWLDEASNTWVPVEGQVNNGDGTLTAPLHHFSIYSSGTNSYIAGPGYVLWHQTDQHAGAATYTIPVPLLSGPGGFKPPDPDITYNSARVDEMKAPNAMGSYVGIGWDLNIPSIRRDPATNRFYLDMNGASDEIIMSSLRTRNELYRRIEAHYSGGTYVAFVVTMKDGTQYRFGNRDGLNNPLTGLQRWYWTWTQGQGWKQEFYRFDLGRVIDTHSNYADYHYVQTNNLSYCPPGAANPTCQYPITDSVPSTLEWGANLNLDNTHRFKLVFSIFQLFRDDAATCSPAPQVVQKSKVLGMTQQVDIGGGEFVTSKQWTFAQQTVTGGCPDAGAFKLTHVAVKGTNGLTLNTYVFGYGSQELSVDYKTSSVSCTSLTWPYLQSAANGFGATTTFTYQYQWQAGSGGADPNCPGSPSGAAWSRQVLASRTENAGLGELMTQTYTYQEGPRYHNPSGLNPIDAEYRGFRQVTATDGNGDYVHCKYYTTGGLDPETGWPNDILTGHAFNCEWLESTGASVKRWLPTWSYRFVADNVNFVYLYENLTHFGTAVDREIFGWDVYGNHNGISESVPVNRWRSTEFYFNTTAWIVGLPAAEVTYRYDGSQPPTYWFPVSKITYLFDQNTAHDQAPTTGDRTREDHYDSAGVAHTRWVWGYDGYGNKTSETKKRDGVNSLTRTFSIDPTYHAYVSSETITSVTPNHTTSYLYDFVLGKQLTKTDPNLQHWNTRYDVHGRVEHEWSPADSENHPTVDYVYTWDATAPNRTTMKRREQSGTTNTLDSWEWKDGLDRTVQTRTEGANCSADVLVTDTAYDKTGQIASVSTPYASTNTGCVPGGYATNPSAAKTSYLYDAIGREVQVTNPHQTPASVRTTTYTGFTEAMIDEKGHKTERIKDAMGRLISVKEYTGTSSTFTLYATTNFSYDLMDRQTGTTDNQGNVWTTNYNNLGFITSTVDPDRGTWTYTYYDDGLLETKSDARKPTAQTITYGYDSLDRITSKSYSGYSSPSTVGYWYDYTPDSYPNGAGMPDGYPVGRLTRVVDWAGEHLHSYDARGRETDERHVVSGSTYDVGHAFDSADREVCTTYPDGEKVGTTFDAQGVIETLKQYPGAGCIGAATETYLTSTEYSPAGMPTMLTYGNGLNVTYGYRSTTDWWLNNISASSMLNYTYGYDAKGNISSISDSIEGTTQTLTYDDRDRLTGVTGLAQVITYSYSDIGNMISKQEGASHYTSMTYPPAGNPRPHAIGQAYYSGGFHTFTYDDNGNMDFERDNASNVIHAYTYNAEGMTASRTSGGASSSYTYGEDGTLFKKDSTVYIGGVYEKAGVEVTKYYFASDYRIAMRRGGTLYFVTSDHLGGTALVTDTNAAMVNRFRYYPFGRMRTEELPVGETEPKTDKLYTGQQRETGNGIYHYKARLYNADIARMPQADLIKAEGLEPAGYNRYSYVYNNPASRTDPSGNHPFTCVGEANVLIRGDQVRPSGLTYCFGHEVWRIEHTLKIQYKAFGITWRDWGGYKILDECSTSVLGGKCYGLTTVGYQLRIGIANPMRVYLTARIRAGHKWDLPPRCKFSTVCTFYSTEEFQIFV